MNEQEEFEFRARMEAEAAKKAATVDAPGKMVSALAGAGKGLGSTILGGQKLVGQGLSKLADLTSSAPSLSDMVAGRKPASMLDQAGQWLQNDADQGRARLSAEIVPYKAANPLSTGAGEVVGEVAATLPVGGVLAKGASMIPGAARAAPLINAVRTGGFSTGAPAATGIAGLAANLGTRAAGGAITGGVSSALVNQDSAGMGAAIGAAVPVVGSALAPIARGTGNAIAAAIGELGTHTGAQSVKEGFRAGTQGNRLFVDNMRGNVPLTDVLETAKQNLRTMGAAKSAEYRAGMAGISADKTVLQFNGIDQALKTAQGIGAYKGQSVNDAAQNKIMQVADKISEWKSLDPVEFHTPEGLDALKKSIGGILESIPYEQKTARTAVGNVYNAIKGEINAQAPTYAKVMKGFEEASDQIKEIERALSLGQQASADTALRKLQSLTRNNANTNFGNRLRLAREMEAQGGQEIIPALSGQAMSALAPRGLGKAVGSANALYSLTNPAAALTLPLQSPRLMGEAAYAAGQAKGGINSLLQQIPQDQRNKLAEILYKATPVATSN